MCQEFDTRVCAKKTGRPHIEDCRLNSFKIPTSWRFKRRKKIWGKCLHKSRRANHPQPPEPHSPELQPPPPFTGLVEVMPKPERGPASTKSTVIPPHVVMRLPSTRNLRESFSKTSSLSFGSSRANPRDGPDQPPCIRAIRRAESILFCSMYSFNFSTAKSVTLNSDMKCLLEN